LVAVKKKVKKAMPAKASAPAGDGSLAQVEAFARNAYGALGMKQFQAWLSAYFHPYQAYDAEKKNADMSTSTVTLALVGLVQAVVAIIVMALALAFASPIVGVPVTLAGAIVILVAYPVASVILGFIGSLLYYIVAMVLGGKGTFWEQTYCFALVSGGVALMSAPFTVLQVIPLLGGIFALVSLVVAIYGVISQYRMIRAVHGLSQLRAAVALLLPVVIIVAVVLVVGIAAIAGLAAYFTAVPVK